MSSVLPDDLAAFLDAASAEPNDLLVEMAEHGEERGFPTLGPHAGRFLALLVRLTGAERVFEFGSGFGYSGAWLLSGLPDEGELVLTDYDADNLAEARDFLSRSKSDATVRYEVGDALETFETYDGPFDLVLVDNDKTQYVETFERVRESIPVGGVVVADNVMKVADMTPADATAALEGQPPKTDRTAGIAAYVEHVRADDAFETAYVPLGEGLAVSTRVA